jgi:hypothetical protein
MLNHLLKVLCLYITDYCMDSVPGEQIKKCSRLENRVMYTCKIYFIPLQLRIPDL